MSINATLLGQMITFALFVWFTMRFVWPLIQKTLAEREQKIAEGLAAGELGKQTLQEAQLEVKRLLQSAHTRAEELMVQAQRQAEDLVAAAQADAEHEKKRILAQGAEEVKQATKRHSVNCSPNWQDWWWWRPKSSWVGL